MASHRHSPEGSAEAARVAVLLVNYFSHEDVGACLSRLRQHADGAVICVSIVDNSCSAAEEAALRIIADQSAGPAFDISVTAPDSNLGYGPGMNAAWAALGADVDVVVLMNPDVRITAGSLARLAREVSASSSLWSAPTRSAGRSLTGQAIMQRWTSATRQIVCGEGPSRGLVYPGGHFVAMSRELWTQLGGMSRSLFLYCEEIDLMLRARAEGFGQLATTNSLQVEHTGGLTTYSPDGTLRPAPLYHATLSRILVYRSHRSLRRYLPTVVLARLLLAAKLAATRHVAESCLVLSALREGFVRSVT